ncbi:hypothetical protein PpBr36_02647 [Pyricularia pennisetigena]|uniref:hypothetical protein n=1 Tax=Pyricularia pennisetigena TaxID=1578925 RepID=UPI00115139F5|nr:hypothetical protein PpBr36_02647 [Pyricularia pennisetigena]TLS30931.1 hypothetical protein PpBr36_02647 [Pyricularia pennisetigena]
MGSDNSGSIRVLSTQRVFPQEPSSHPITARLSIIDNTVARFALTAAIWFYDKPNAAPQEHVFPALQTSLARTLNDYRHFAGQLRWATADEVRHTAVPRHLGRLVAEYGTAYDPGVELVTAEYDAGVADVVIDRRDLAQISSKDGHRLHIWDATDLPRNDFLPAIKVALSSLGITGGVPSVAIQLTRFRCGGFAVGVKMAHPLADAIGLIWFMRRWAAFSRAEMLGSGADGQGEPFSSAPPPPPLFDPDRMDRLAGLVPSKESTKESTPDQHKIATARALPMHRHDWWDSSAPGYPAWARASSEATMPPPSATDDASPLSPSQQPPWPSWDVAAPVTRVQILFPAATVALLRTTAEEAARANTAGTTPPPPPPPRISRLDAMLAHLWILINRARYAGSGPTEQAEEVYLDMTLGLRSRFSPPLPDGFAGSPLLIAHTTQKAGELALSSSSSSSSPEALLGGVATSIRETVGRFTPEAVAAHVHDAAHEVSPQRLWQAFLGRRHTLATSWQGLGAYSLDFCGRGGVAARNVQAIMPDMDGLLHVVDVDGTGGALDVSLCLEKGAMERLLQDPALRVGGVAVEMS